MNRLLTSETGVPSGIAQAGKVLSEEEADLVSHDAASSDRHGWSIPARVIWLLLPIILIGGVGGLSLMYTAKRKKSVAANQLTQADREQVLRDIRQWIEGPVKPGAFAETYK